LRICQRRTPIAVQQGSGGRIYTNEEDGKMLLRYWTTACQNCLLKSQCTTGPERRITRWEHEQLLEAVQQRLDANPQATRQLRETVEHPFGTMKARMGQHTSSLKRFQK
jgi:Transposase DDE domain